MQWGLLKGIVYGLLFEAVGVYTLLIIHRVI
jgi:hypothetical protein